MDSKQLCKMIPGHKKQDARRVYQALESHFLYTAETCPYCKPYPHYGVMLMSGNYLEHIEQLIKNGQNIVVSDIAVQLGILDDAELLEVEEITERQHRMTFCMLAPMEVLA